MSIAKSLPATLKELRVHMCQTSSASNGLRCVNLEFLGQMGDLSG
jgi:hypothetical protein